MSQNSKRELLATLRLRYVKARRQQKQQILDELVATTGYNRKYAIQLLKHPAKRQSPKKRLRERKYTPAVVMALEQVWRAANGIASKRLVPNLLVFVEALERHGELSLDAATRPLLLLISPATADRLLKQTRQKAKGHGLSTTKPGTLLKQAIAVRTFADWDDTVPGFVEVDLVAHCHDSAGGEFLSSLDMIDVATRWTECLGLVNKSQATVTAAIHHVQKRLPFPLLGIDSDNGSEFINANLLRYCEQHQMTFTRSRPYKKNDQCYVEQKNWSLVRQMVGYDRFEGQSACDALNALYDTLHLYVNFFQPIMVLQSKERVGAQVKKRYHPAQTPYQRVLLAATVSQEVKARLQAQYLTLNPAALLRQIEQQQAALWKLAKTTPWP